MGGPGFEISIVLTAADGFSDITYTLMLMDEPSTATTQQASGSSSGSSSSDSNSGGSSSSSSSSSSSRNGSSSSGLAQSGAAFGSGSDQLAASLANTGSSSSSSSSSNSLYLQQLANAQLYNTGTVQTAPGAERPQYAAGGGGGWLTQQQLLQQVYGARDAAWPLPPALSRTAHTPYNNSSPGSGTGSGSQCSFCPAGTVSVGLDAGQCQLCSPGRCGGGRGAGWGGVRSGAGRGGVGRCLWGEK